MYILAIEGAANDLEQVEVERLFDRATVMATSYIASLGNDSTETQDFNQAFYSAIGWGDTVGLDERWYFLDLANSLSNHTNPYDFETDSQLTKFSRIRSEVMVAQSLEVTPLFLEMVDMLNTTPEEYKDREEEVARMSPINIHNALREPLIEYIEPEYIALIHRLISELSFGVTDPGIRDSLPGKISDYVVIADQHRKLALEYDPRTYPVDLNGDFPTDRYSDIPLDSNLNVSSYYCDNRIELGRKCGTGCFSRIYNEEKAVLDEGVRKLTESHFTTANPCKTFAADAPNLFAVGMTLAINELDRGTDLLIRAWNDLGGSSAIQATYLDDWESSFLVEYGIKNLIGFCTDNIEGQFLSSESAIFCEKNLLALIEFSSRNSLTIQFQKEYPYLLRLIQIVAMNCATFLILNQK